MSENTQITDPVKSTEDEKFLYQILMEGYHFRDVAIAEIFHKAFVFIAIHFIFLVSMLMVFFYGYDSSNSLPNDLLAYLQGLSFTSKMIAFFFALTFGLMMIFPFYRTVSSMTSSKNALRKGADYLESKIITDKKARDNYGYWTLIRKRQRYFFESKAREKCDSSIIREPVNLFV